MTHDAVDEPTTHEPISQMTMIYRHVNKYLKLVRSLRLVWNVTNLTTYTTLVSGFCLLA